MKSLEQKLYNPRNIEGEPNTDDLQDVRFLESKLSKIPEFVSLSIQGSIVKGYSDKSSDVDLTIFFDSSGVEPNSKDYRKIQEQLSDVAQETKSEIWDRKKEEKQKPKNFQFRFVDINTDVTEHDFLPKTRFKKLALLFSLSTGKKIESYRKYWTERINNLSDEEKEKWVSEISSILAENTDMDYETLKKRVAISDEKALLESRKNLWRRRIENFLAFEK
jgi:predicted nucleotidyltransferase